LNREKKDEPVDEPKELVEVFFYRQRAALEIGAQGLVLGLRKEALAECHKRLFDTTPKVLTRTRPFLTPRGAPRFKHAIGDWLTLPSEARLVAKQPECGEVSVTLLGEDSLQVGLNPRGSGKARVVTHNPQRTAVASDTPQRCR